MAVLDSRFLSSIRAVVSLKIYLPFALLVVVAIVVAVVRLLIYVGVVLLLFIGVGLFGLLAVGLSRVRKRYVLRAAREEVTGTRRPSDARQDELPDYRPITVQIDRDPQWHNFKDIAWILHLHVVMTNETASSKEIRGFVWRACGADLVYPRAKREALLRTLWLPNVLRCAVLEPGASESGWAFCAFPYTGRPPAFTFAVQVDGDEYDAR